jgi:carbonic anhydrase
MKKFTAWHPILIFSLIIGLMTVVNPIAASGPVHWTYEGAEGPEFWGNLSPEFALCSTGVEQSPIDIAGTATANPADITFNYQPTALNIFNNGHTIQVNYDPGSAITVGGKTYTLKQFHFHLPSEHTRASQPSAMELHFVHQSDDNQLAVVGVMLDSGSENPAYAPLFNHLPAQESEPTAVSGVTVNGDDLLPQDRTYNRYNGSLTTPPCTEGVQWLVMTTPVQLSDAQIEAFRAIFPKNARPVQPFNDRQFLTTSALASTPEALPATGGIPVPIEAVLFGLGLLTTATGLYLLRRREA